MYSKTKEKLEFPILTGRQNRGVTVSHVSSALQNFSTVSNQGYLIRPLENTRPRGTSGHVSRGKTDWNKSQSPTDERLTDNGELSLFRRKKLHSEGPIHIESRKNRLLQDALINRANNSGFKNETMVVGRKSSILSPVMSPTLRSRGDRLKESMIFPGRKKKKKGKERKKQVNNDTNYNFYSDPDQSGKICSSSSDSNESINSIMSSGIIPQGAFLDSHNNSFVALEGNTPTFPTTFSPKQAKKSRFAQCPVNLKGNNEDDDQEEDAQEEEKEKPLFLDNLSQVESEEEGEETDQFFSFSPMTDDKIETSPLTLVRSSIFSTMSHSGVKENGLEHCLLDDDKKIQDIVKLKTKISNKKAIKRIYDFIVEKGKLLLNDGAFQKSKIKSIQLNFMSE